MSPWLQFPATRTDDDEDEFEDVRKVFQLDSACPQGFDFLDRDTDLIITISFVHPRGLARAIRLRVSNRPEMCKYIDGIQTW